MEIIIGVTVGVMIIAAAIVAIVVIVVITVIKKKLSSKTKEERLQTAKKGNHIVSQCLNVSDMFSVFMLIFLCTFRLRFYLKRVYHYTKVFFLEWQTYIVHILTQRA